MLALFKLDAFELFGIPVVYVLVPIVFVLENICFISWVIRKGNSEYEDDADEEDSEEDDAEEHEEVRMIGNIWIWVLRWIWRFMQKALTI